MEEAQSKGATELPAWLVENRDFRKFLKEAEKVRVLVLNSPITFKFMVYVINIPVIYIFQVRSFLDFFCLILSRLQYNQTDQLFLVAVLPRRHPFSLLREVQNKRRLRNLSKYTHFFACLIKCYSTVHLSPLYTSLTTRHIDIND